MLRTLSAPSELLVRHLDLFKDQNLALVGQIHDDFALDLLEHSASVTVYCNHFGHYQHLQTQERDQLKVVFTASPVINETIDTLILYMPKAKAEAQFLLAQVLAQLQPGTTIFIVGENKGGVNAAPNLLKEHQLSCQKIDSARRCSLYFSELEGTIKAFELESWIKQIPDLQSQLELVSLPGVFGHGKLDEGTKLLLEHLPKLSGSVLDFGCGCGVIALSLATQSTLKVSGLDVSAYAIESCRLNQQYNQINAHFFASDGLNEVKDSYDVIVSNPPFHEGTKTQYQTSETFLKQAKQHLRPEGELWLVANKFLAYESILQSHFSTVREVASNGRFKILAAS
ncbi:16S rRNA (guanine(1207)-N(2))-methyltransferase RsmC [Alginatibacterium sediminis]|nr:16S rRNA (guanine(1207)-N(2))-methyltransferase RsmC [Alginatibacterium sediminis]